MLWCILWYTLLRCGFSDQNSANVCPCARRKRRHIKGYKLPYFHVLIACTAFLHAVRRMNLDRWALGCPDSGNILFQRRMSSIFWTNGIPEEILSYSHSRQPDLPVTRFSPFSTWLSVLFFFSSPAKTTQSGQGYGFSRWRR